MLINVPQVEKKRKTELKVLIEDLKRVRSIDFCLKRYILSKSIKTNLKSLISDPFLNLLLTNLNTISKNLFVKLIAQKISNEIASKHLFGFRNYDFYIKTVKFKMGDLIWPIIMIKILSNSDNTRREKRTVRVTNVIRLIRSKNKQ